MIIYIKKSYWFPKHSRVTPSDQLHDTADKEGFEKEPKKLKITVCIQNLSKVNESLNKIF